MDSDLAWVNGKSGRQSWRYADAFQRSIISEAIHHLPWFYSTQLVTVMARTGVWQDGILWFLHIITVS